MKCESCGHEFKPFRRRTHRFCSKLCQKRTWQKGIYYQKNLEKLRKQGREYYWKNREKQKEYYMNYLKILRRKIEQLLGKKCIVCGEKSRHLECHETHGKSHKENPNPAYIIEHYKDFARLCFYCHRAIHSFSKSRLIKASNQKRFLGLVKKLQ